MCGMRLLGSLNKAPPLGDPVPSLGQDWVEQGVSQPSALNARALSTHNASVKTTIHAIIKCLIHCHSISHNIASDQETHFTAKEVQQQHMLIEFTVFPTVLEQLA